MCSRVSGDAGLDNCWILLPKAKALSYRPLSWLAQVSLDLASFEVVRHAWGTLAAVLQEGLLHTVFANEEEAAAVLAQAGKSGQYLSPSSFTFSITLPRCCGKTCCTPCLPTQAGTKAQSINSRCVIIARLKERYVFWCGKWAVLLA